MDEQGYQHLALSFWGWGMVLGGSAEDVVEQCALFLLCFKFGIFGSSSGHSGGKGGCYMCDWAFSNISVLQSIPLHRYVHHLGENDG
jgi:hypothetical protein